MVFNDLDKNYFSIEYSRNGLPRSVNDTGCTNALESALYPCSLFYLVSFYGVWGGGQEIYFLGGGG